VASTEKGARGREQGAKSEERRAKSNETQKWETPNAERPSQYAAAAKVTGNREVCAIAGAAKR